MTDSPQGLVERLHKTATCIYIAVEESVARDVAKTCREAAARIEALEAALREAQKDAAAYKWGYEYLKNRMESIAREGWARDCDDEIAARKVGTA